MLCLFELRTPPVVGHSLFGSNSHDADRNIESHRSPGSRGPSHPTFVPRPRGIPFSTLCILSWPRSCCENCSLINVGCAYGVKEGKLLLGKSTAKVENWPGSVIEYPPPVSGGFSNEALCAASPLRMNTVFRQPSWFITVLNESGIFLSWFAKHFEYRCF